MLESELAHTESARIEYQITLDAERTAKQRNEMGQFATPNWLAQDIMRFVLRLQPRQDIRFLEPSCGTGSFYSAFLTCIDTDVRFDAIGVELDKRFVSAARKLWSDSGLHVIQGDFFEVSPKLPHDRTLVVANPPYVRHHHIDSTRKKNLQNRVKADLGINVSGLAGLYVYFLLLTDRLMADNAVGAWLIPAEFLDTNYGRAVRQYLASRVSIERIHRFDPENTQFDDALVSSAVVVYTKRRPPEGHLARFTQGGTTCQPEAVWSYRQKDLDPNCKWGNLFSERAVIDDNHAQYPRFDTFFKIRRGIATGDNKFFILPRKHLENLGIKRSSVVPIMPAPRHLQTDIVESDDSGYPLLDINIAVIQPRGRNLEEVRSNDPALAEYLATVTDRTLNKYIVKHRKIWFKPEKRNPAPFLLTYMGRETAKDNKPFRFVLNRSQAICTNMFLMLYPIGPLKKAIDDGLVTLDHVYDALQAITANELLDSGRVYGGGLRKMEPHELAGMNARTLATLVPTWQDHVQTQDMLF